MLRSPIRPLKDMVVVLPDELQTLASDIIAVPQAKYDAITDSDRQLSHVGTVVAVGPGKETKRGIRVPLEVKPGDRVTWGEFIFPCYQTDDGTKYYVIQEADITGVYAP